MLLVRRQRRENSSLMSLEPSHCHSISTVRHQQCPACGPPGCAIFNIYIYIYIYIYTYIYTHSRSGLRSHKKECIICVVISGCRSNRELRYSNSEGKISEVKIQACRDIT